MNLVNIKDQNLVRDIDNMAVINTDQNEYEQYMLKRKLFANQKADINNIRSEMDDIKSEISQIKNLLMELVKNGN
jgi:hypothetical protein